MYGASLKSSVAVLNSTAGELTSSTIIPYQVEDVTCRDHGEGIFTSFQILQN